MSDMISCSHCGGTGKVPKPQPVRPLNPPLSEGARFQHDCWNCVFLGQYDDGDLYACFSEYASDEKAKEYGLSSGQYGSLLVVRFANIRNLGVREMLHDCSVSRSSGISMEDDPYLATAYRLVKEKGWIQEPDRNSRVQCLRVSHDEWNRIKPKWGEESGNG
jgi:hypothetical protein